VVGNLGSAAFHPTAAAIVNRVGGERRGTAMSVHVTGGAIGNAVAPLVFAPYAARFPFETWIVPKQHQASFQDSPRQIFRQLGEALKVALFKLDRALQQPAYSFTLHNAPFQDDRSESYHWHLEIMPALAAVTGFELGSGFYINPTPPEESARYLREETPLGL